ncbi:GntR family transcriptional regulator [Amylibacter sp.]|jgi:DNA-binding GntR family transcriptional regulator|nr:GntR family transcriptional regulator [Amylibacter sp.]MDA9582646.1 GntR family transcriptional regulator [Amylibacter sp.]MDC0982835.1 GntR family transcriptional regulator [Amylibacter sp.]|tara:strand:+ start:1604 stop:2236 length:633 start_codon:yes stop_codon:yes gene_type:complete
MSLPTPIYQQLINAIEKGDLRPGDRMLETELASRFGVSRTPIREAIRRLETDGLVVHKPRIGAMVRLLAQQEIVELYEMRIVLEATAAQMAAKHCSNAETRTLQDLNDQMLAHSKDPFAVATLNRKFHTCIFNAARNRFLAQSYNSLSYSLILLGKTTLETDERVQNVYAQHEAIIGALISGDTDIASEVMRLHMETSLDHRLKVLQIAE